MPKVITIEFYAGNLFYSVDCASAGVDADATLNQFQALMEQALQDYAITWRILSGEGPAIRAYDAMGLNEDATLAVENAAAEVYNTQRYWIMEAALPL